MGGNFNVNEYWLKRGKSYIDEKRLSSEYYRLQEHFILDTLLNSKIPIKKILEIGCGFGRITKLILEAFPNAQITALDLSPDQLENAKNFCDNNKNITFLQYDIYSGNPLPRDKYDIAIAIEVFLHHPLDIVRNLVEKLAAISTYIVNLDWSEEWLWEVAEHVWVHDYGALYQDAGLECKVFVVPQKIEGMQQKLFMASRG